MSSQLNQSYADAAQEKAQNASKTADKKSKQTEKDVKAEAEKAKHDAKDALDNAAKKGKAEVDKLEKEFHDLEDRAKPYVKRLVAAVLDKWAQLSSRVRASVNRDQVHAAAEELKNPVVVGQIAVAAGGAVAGWFVYSERNRIRSENKYVVAIHAGIITGLVLADAYVVSKLYPKYKRTY